MKRGLAILRIIFFIFKIIGSLIFVWIMISWHVRRARRSFEDELMKAGVSKEDAQRLSRCFVDLKDQMKTMMKSPFSFGRELLKSR